MLWLPRIYANAAKYNQYLYCQRGQFIEPGPGKHKHKAFENMKASSD